MTLDEYQAEAEKTVHPSADAVYLAGKLMCEAAEVAEPIFKLRYHGKLLDVNATLQELGDVLWYVATLAAAMGLSLEDVGAANVEKLRQRHGTQYNEAFYRG